MRPSVEVEVIELMPEMVDSCRSIGAATEDAMVSALRARQGRGDQDGGKSTAGSAATGSSR